MPPEHPSDPRETSSGPGSRKGPDTPCDTLESTVFDTASPETRTAQALGWIDPTTRGVVPSIQLATTFERAPDGSYPGGADYLRDGHPDARLPERLMAELEGGEEALLFASGMSAATAAFEALAIGARILAPDRMYWGLRRWLESRHAAGRFELTTYRTGDLESLETALRAGPAGLAWVETPANPTLEVTDIAAAAELCRRHETRLAVDNTVPTPVLTRPLELGADLVMHSASKQLNGHSDVLAGALVTARPDDAWSAMVAERIDRGTVLGPFECWLLVRGLRTLFLRVGRSNDSAATVAAALVDHPRVSAVLYPGLPDHPGHAIARRQMKGGFGSLISLRIRDGEAAAREVANRLRIFHQATSLGGVESLVEHRASVEGPASRSPVDLLRLSIGIEDPRDLIADLERALR